MMKRWSALFSKRCNEFIPKSLICFQEGYCAKHFYNDLFAGACVGIIAIPLAIAFAIASGVAPEKGLYTAIIAGFLISLLGGSRVQIGGPTGAFVVIIYSIVSQFGYEGLALATLIGGILMILMGLARFGLLLKFIPHPVTVGFTTGIALVIFSSQIKDFFGLEIDRLPTGFVDKWALYYQSIATYNIWAIAISITTLFTILFLRRSFPKFPGAMLAILLATLAASLFHLPVETIGSKFGSIPRTLPKPTLPFFSIDLFFAVFPSAVTVALLGAIESLLSASVADGMTGHKHRSNCELVAQGLANLCSIFFGGIPATGAIARTSANIKLGGKTPVAGIIHAFFILLLMLFLAPFVAKIPLAALAGVLVFVTWNMSELPHFWEIVRAQKGDALALLITFALTVLIDLTVAVQVGVALSAIIFLKRMTDKTSLKICKILEKDNLNETPYAHEEGTCFLQPPSSEIAIFEINGPFFYTVAHLLDEALQQLEVPPKVFILSLEKTPLIDFTGIKALKLFNKKCYNKDIAFLISGAKPELLKKTKIDHFLTKHQIFSSIDSALNYSQHILNKISILSLDC